MKKLVATLTAFALLSVVMQISANPRATPGYNQSIPVDIVTPDTVKTRIGELTFYDGLPDKKTVKKLYNNLDFMRGVEVFLNMLPAASLEALRTGHKEYGSTRSNQVVIFDELMDSNPLWLTGNTDTVYASVFLNLKKDGPVVVEIPPGSGPGTVNDAFFRFVTDMGAPGPDKGKGGKYLILPPDYKGNIPKGYFVSRSTSYTNWVILRGFLKDGKPNYASKSFRSGLKVYPLSREKNPPKMNFINASKKPVNTIHANSYKFYQELNDVVQREPVKTFDPELRGLMASIGIEKGKEFRPDQRMRKILTDSVAVGNATARSIAFRPREKGAYIYKDRKWQTGFLGGSFEWLKDKGKGGRYQDARTLFFYIATVNTPAMQLAIPGVGSQYALASVDKKGNYLHGDDAYKLHLPANVPAKDFWSIVVYDPQTRSELQTKQGFPSKNNKRNKDLHYNRDGSIDLYFGPHAPKGKEANWIETVPTKGWFAIIRLYGPLKPWFKQTWKPGDITKIKQEKS
jgi:hypothetical protein